ncbi:SIMPL domain-containing protein [Gulosibacter sp. 10]|uniref:SIMPL domain-containing protein n=1 Tax=Gulosibacter sp. 10 TaxID=1255570 RepID=UPI00097E7EB3|nr:SIMPL domain-containing protein [Gulosibacter sp. 10]SJM49627.1 hypothetical protein FM112_01155 [Gulosibacter sp. 10]
MTTIRAHGTGESHHRAERATVSAHISVASRDRSRSIAEASSLHNRIAERAHGLRERGDATWHAADPISTWTRKTYEQGSKSKVILEYVTSSRVRIKLANLDLVASLVTELAEAGVRTSVDWALTEAFRLQCERRARKAAVAEARARAEDYADALGERIDRVAIVEEPAEGAPLAAQARFASANAGGGEAEVSIPEITVRATVRGEFETAPAR